MAIGLAGDTSVSIGGDPISELQLIEMRVTTNLLQSLLGTNQAADELNTVRNDQAFELGIPVPVPGNAT